MRASLVIDPAVLAMPAIANDEESLALSLSLLVELSRTLRQFDHCDVRMIEDAENYLAQANLYPVTDSIQKSLSDSKLSHVYTTEDIRRSVQHILQRLNRLEEVSQVNFLVPISVSCEPDILEDRVGPLREALEVTMIHAAFATELSSKGLVQTLVAGRQINSDISILANVDDINPPTVRGTCLKDYNASFRMCQSLESFIDSLDGQVLWKVADDEGEAISAIKMAACHLRREAGCENPHAMCEEFIFGPMFFATLQGSQAVGSGKYAGATCETCSQIIAKSPNVQPKKMFRLSDTGKRTDVTRADGAVAWRMHVTKSGEAIRLMFWRLTDGTIELASVAPKNVIQVQ